MLSVGFELRFAPKPLLFFGMVGAIVATVAVVAGLVLLATGQGVRSAWVAIQTALLLGTILFVSGLLDLTDNVVSAVDASSTVVPPPDVVRHDGDDPYLVVAADQGTATFSVASSGAGSAPRTLALGDLTGDLRADAVIRAGDGCAPFAYGRDGANAAPIARNREFISAAATTAALPAPPLATMDTAANCADPA